MSKSLKKAAKTEDNSATVLKRIGEMTMGVQIIAENVDSMNDINKRLETLDEIKVICCCWQQNRDGRH